MDKMSKGRICRKAPNGTPVSQTQKSVQRRRGQEPAGTGTSKNESLVKRRKLERWKSGHQTKRERIYCKNCQLKASTEPRLRKTCRNGSYTKRNQGGNVFCRREQEGRGSGTKTAKTEGGGNFQPLTGQFRPTEPQGRCEVPEKK